MTNRDESRPFATQASLSELRRTVWTRLHALGVAENSDIGALRDALAAERGRPIELIPVSTGAGPHGLCVEADAADYIAYERDTTPLHQQHIAAHELAHLACGHNSGLTRDQAVQMLAPRVEGQAVRLVLGRTMYSGAEEQEAELFATLFLERVSTAAPLAVSPAAVARFEALLCGREAQA
jgi:hypothetical protein